MDVFKRLEKINWSTTSELESLVADLIKANEWSDETHHLVAMWALAHFSEDRVAKSIEKILREAK